MNPRMPASPPLMPTIIFAVDRQRRDALCSSPACNRQLWRHQRTAPDFASSATRWQSSVPTYSVSPSTADAAIHASEADGSDSPWESVAPSPQCRPVCRSSAVTMVGGSVTYITPSNNQGRRFHLPALFRPGTPRSVSIPRCWRASTGPGGRSGELRNFPNRSARSPGSCAALTMRSYGTCGMGRAGGEKKQEYPFHDCPRRLAR